MVQDRNGNHARAGVAVGLAVRVRDAVGSVYTCIGADPWTGTPGFIHMHESMTSMPWYHWKPRDRMLAVR
jgi:hypothetical protein